MAQNTQHNMPGHDAVYVRDTGTDRFPLVLVHGSGASSAVFAEQFDSHLADHYRMIAPDLPGHGASGNASRPEETYTLRGYASVIAEVLNARGIERAAFFGWSLGGHVVMELLGASDFVAGAMLTGAPPVRLGPVGILRGFQTKFDLLLGSKVQFNERDRQRFAQICYGSNPPECVDDLLVRADGLVRKHFFQSMMAGKGADQQAAVTNADVPVAIVNGENEPFVRRSHVEAIAYGNLWRGEIETVINAGHAPFLEQPDTFNILLDRFAHHVKLREKNLLAAANDRMEAATG